MVDFFYLLISYFSALRGIVVKIQSKYIINTMTIRNKWSIKNKHILITEEREKNTSSQVLGERQNI